MLRDRLLLLGLLLLAPACASSSEDDDGGGGVGFATGSEMRPGSDCRRCHSKDSDYPSAPEWTLAGTVYPLADSPAEDGVEGVTVKVTAPDGAEVLSLTTNRVGNFYTSKPLPADYRVALEYQGERIEMPCPPPSGGCAKCHGQPPIGEAPGRIYVPQGEVRPNPAFDCEAWATVPTASASGN